MLFAAAFPELPLSDSIAFRYIIESIAVFTRGLNSFNSHFDRYCRGATAAMWQALKRGEALFIGERLDCFHCHD